METWGQNTPRSGVVSAKGIEPLTNGLKGHCSAIELRAQRDANFITHPVWRQFFQTNRFQIGQIVIHLLHLASNSSAGKKIQKPALSPPENFTSPFIALTQ
jgi:hypothetical protein